MPRPKKTTAPKSPEPSAPSAPPAPPAPPTPDRDKLDYKPILLDVVTEFGAPIAPAQVSDLTEIPIPRVIEILDELVTDSKLVLGDDQFYRLVGEESEAEKLNEPESPALTGHDALERFRTVSLPTSDLIAFLSNINLPPELLAGFGSLSGVAGELNYELLDDDGNDLEATCRFTVEIHGRHRITQPRLNPNQPGYVKPIPAPRP